MFRDPMISAFRAAEVLAALPPQESTGRARAEAMAVAESGRPAEECSPIDGRWAAAHLAQRRLAALNRALGRR